MLTARFFLALAICAGAVLAACSGNLGGGTSAPGGLLPSGSLSGIAPTSSPTPSTMQDIVTYGDSAAFQPLPSVGGYGGAIAFATPNPRPSGFEAIPIGATLSVISPGDAPDLNVQTAGKKGKKRERPARPLVYLSLLATHDISLSAIPRIAIDVPRDIATTYRVNEINVALYNSGEKEQIYKLAASEHDSASPPPMPTPGLTAPPPPSPVGATVASPGAIASAPLGIPSGFPNGALTPPPAVPGAVGPGTTAGAPLASPTLPPQRILFAATATALKLTANRPVVFAIYALPIATPSPSPKPSGSASANATASASASAAPRGSASPEASASATSASASPSPSTISVPSSAPSSTPG